MGFLYFIFIFIFFSFFFSFSFLNHVILDLGTKSCMQLALWHIKNLNSKKLTKEITKFKQYIQKFSKQDHQSPVASPSMTNKKI